MTYGCAIGAIYALAVGRHEHAVVWALLAIAFAVLRLRPSWIAREWRAAMTRERREADATLFEGHRED